MVFMTSLSLRPAEAFIYPYEQGNRLTLMEDPKDAVETKLEMVRQAKHHIHIITYFWDDSSFPKKLAHELMKANERGVEVRILTTFVPSVATDVTGRAKKWLTPEIPNAVMSFLRLKPVEGLSISNNLHEKIFLVDGQKAILGGRNISDSSFRGKDMEVMLEGPVVNQVQQHFKIMHDFLTQLEINSACRSQIEFCMDMTQSYYQTLFYENDPSFFPEQPVFENGVTARILTHEAVLKQHMHTFNIKQRLYMTDDIMNTVLKTEFKTLRAYNYFIIPTDDYKDFLLKNIKAGKDIKVITNSKRSAAFVSNKGYLYSLPDLKELARKGLNIYQWNGDGELAYLHEKVMIFDEDHVMIGSHNFGIGSTSVSNEIAIEFKSPEIASRLIQIFDQEISDEKLTKKAREKTFNREIDEDSNWVKFLRTNLIGDILQELY